MRTQILEQIIKEHPEATQTKYKYKAMTGMLKRMFPEIYYRLTWQEWDKIVYEVVNADRDWRKVTEEHHKREKKILSDEWKVNHGYMPVIR